MPAIIGKNPFAAAVDVTEVQDASTGQIIVATPAATTIGAAGTYVAANASAFSFNSALAENFDNPSVGRLRYTGINTALLTASCAVTFTGQANNDLGFRLAINGVTVASSTMRSTVRANGDLQAITIHELISLATNDFVELFLTNETIAQDVTVENMNLLVYGLTRLPAP